VVLCGGFVISGSVDEQPHFDYLPPSLLAGVTIASRMSTALSTKGLLRSGSCVVALSFPVALMSSRT